MIGLLDTRTTRRLRTALSIPGFCVAVAAFAQCPLVPVPDKELAPILRDRGTATMQSPNAIAFRSSLERDDDGDPRAYHVGLKDGGKDDGLDHICNAGDILEFRDGKLVNRYAEGGTIGQLDGIDPATGVKRSALCKRDYLTIRDAGFPPCAPGALCMNWYGVVAEQRTCGFNLADQTGCGIPVRQKQADGSPGPFYVSPNALIRPGSPGRSQVQSDYADASQVPFIVIPKRLEAPNDMTIHPRDLAVVVWRDKIVYAVVGDIGPAKKIGEASHALLKALGTTTGSPGHPLTTVIFPGTADRLADKWPLIPTVIETEGHKLVDAANRVGKLSSCEGLESLR